ncbi:MAG: hypothetical protein ACI9R3_005601 [Verrucomicrobiales bacterium]|jgi:hypothetical protein
MAIPLTPAVHFGVLLSLVTIALEGVASDGINVLTTKCLECHSGSEPKGKLDLTMRTSALRGGESGAAVVPGNADDSLMWKHVNTGEMPPKKKQPLTEEQKQALQEWIAAGAPYPKGGIDYFAQSTSDRAGYDWWALQPVTRPQVPSVNDPDGWSRGDIDRFILAKLHEHDLEPSPESDPLTQVRRLFFDLIGLPPTPEQVVAFVAAPSDTAYQKLVDDLLSSPHYGERWGRHWLDLARFGESDGFERNSVRENQWHFRDWVIKALNEDIPYDEFAKLQIAGDLHVSGKEGLAAAAFLTAGVHNTVVGGSEFMRKTARQDELEEIAGTVGQTFIGLTVNCARCHDHKFDPITQKEYYQFVSALSGIRHGEKEYRDAAGEATVAKLEKEITEVETEIKTIDSPAISQILENRQQPGASKPELPPVLFEWTFDSGFADSSARLTGTAAATARIAGGALVIDDKQSYVETAPLPVTLRAKTLEALVQLNDLNQRGGGAISIQDKSGTVFDAIVYGEREGQRWMAGSNTYSRSQEFSGDKEESAVDRPILITIVYHEDGTIERYRDGTRYGKTYKTSLQPFEAGNTVVRFGIRHLPTGMNKHLNGRIHHARLYDRALNRDEVAATAGVENLYVSENEIIESLTEQQRSHRLQLVSQRDRLSKELSDSKAKTKGKVYTVNANASPGTTKFLPRGNAMNEGDVLAPGAIKSVKGVTPDFNLAPDAPDAERRKRLADWITSPDNPLFARVIANRIWHYHFGAGIVETPNDLGHNGGRPSHPELLNWLASEIAVQGWSLKKLHKLIVTSAAYRQSSRPTNTGIGKDASNRLLWRKSPIRLDGESLRDSMLMVSGALNPAQYGPGFRDVKVEYKDGTTYYTPFDEENDEFHRRTIYRFSPRGGRNSILDTFDCPDPATTAPRRTVTTTPLQALALLNNDFAIRIGKHFVKRIVKEGGHGLPAQVERAYQLAYGRSPDPDETTLAAQLVTQHGLAALVRVLFNSNEFVVIE